MDRKLPLAAACAAGSSLHIFADKSRPANRAAIGAEAAMRGIS
jgi:hypothetical protein